VRSRTSAWASARLSRATSSSAITVPNTAMTSPSLRWSIATPNMTAMVGASAAKASSAERRGGGAARVTAGSGRTIAAAEGTSAEAPQHTRPTSHTVVCPTPIEESRAKCTASSSMRLNRTSAASIPTVPAISSHTARAARSGSG